MSKTAGLLFITGKGHGSMKMRHAFSKSMSTGGLIKSVDEVVDAVDNISEAYPKFIDDQEIKDGQVYALVPISPDKNKETVTKVMAGLRKIRKGRENAAKTSADKDKPKKRTTKRKAKPKAK